MSQRPKLNRVWSSLNHAFRRDPGDDKYLQGWVSEIPTYQVFNYLQYKNDIALLALAERGIFEWGDDIQYQLGSVTWDESDKRIYVAIVNKPDKTKRPSKNSNHWSPSAIQVTRLEYDNVVAAINNHIADVTGNPHRLTAGRLGAYNKNEIDNILAQYRVLVANHANDKNNPHDTKAVDIGAVAITGGTYTGDVVFGSNTIYMDSRKVSSITSKNDGIWQVRGEYALGVDSAGVAKTGKFGNMSKLISELEFAEYKFENTPDYRTPAPTFAKNYVSDMHISSGSEYSEGNLDPYFGNGYAHIVSGTTRLLDVCTPCPLTGRTQFTFAIDIYIDVKSNNSTSAEFDINVSGERVLLFHGNNLVIFRGYRQAAGVQYKLPTDRWLTVVGVAAKDKLFLYVDGVLVAQGPNDNSQLGAANISVAVAQTSFPRDWRWRNLRAWNEALTDKQVSTI